MNKGLSRMHEELRLDNQLCFRLYTASRLITQAYKPLLNWLGITYPQYLVLMVLWEQDCLPVNDIAHRLLLETNTVTPLLKRIEKLGLVERQKGIEDGRRTLVSLTEKGKALEQQAFECIPQGMGKRMEPCRLSLDDYARLRNDLDNIIDKLK